jgi:uncharacterized membrane-anchored protein
VIARILIGVGAVMVFGVMNWEIAGKERLRATGDVVYLELAPVDPRSLMQGDYMALRFSLTRSITQESAKDFHAVVLNLDDRRVGTFDHFDNGQRMASGQVRFRYRVRNEQIWLGTNAFFFKEGEAGRYEGARFGEFRVNEAGDAMLVGLRDKDLRHM